MLDATQLNALQVVLVEELPEWSASLRVVKDERSKGGVLVSREDRLYDAVEQLTPPRRGVGSSVFLGAVKDIAVFLDHVDFTIPPLDNGLSIEIYHRPTVEGESTATWAKRCFERIVSSLPVRYARGRTSEEFAAKNRIEDERSAEAIGVDLIDAIPGMYWMNFFGPEYLELIGRERLLSAPAYESLPAGDGVLLSLDASPEAWCEPEYKEREHAVIGHIGRKYFFSRDDPDRQTVAPDFQPYQPGE